jgi:hypothetical protein
MPELQAEAAIMQVAALSQHCIVYTPAYASLQPQLGVNNIVLVQTLSLT